MGEDFRANEAIVCGFKNSEAFFWHNQNPREMGSRSRLTGQTKNHTDMKFCTHTPPDHI